MATKSRKSYIQLNIEGFDELLKQIADAGGSINGAVNSCMKKSAKIQHEELQTQMLSIGRSMYKVDEKNKNRKSSHIDELVSSMPPPEITWDGNACTARVGYHKGAYDPHNLSDGYKAVFINYGTPRIEPRNFIEKAKKKATPKIKKLQKETLNEILEGLKK